jgi:rod shape-determining protein MreC
MRNLFRFILGNHVFFLFIILEILSFVFIFNFNNYQKVKFLNSSSRLTGKVYDSYSNLTQYFNLPSVNRELAQENARLRGMLEIHSTLKRIPDSLFIRFPAKEQVYSYIPARIISNSVDRQQNYLTLDKGSRDGIKPDMGIISANGVTGIITNVSPSFSTGLSLLNTRWNISAKLAKNNYFGSLTWDGKNYRHALLNEIPYHVELTVGDTIVTSGYSTIFPEGVLLGIIESFEKRGGDNFYTISVKLSVDFKSVSYVEIIENKEKQEILSIQKLNSDDEKVD